MIYTSEVNRNEKRIGRAIDYSDYGKEINCYFDGLKYWGNDTSHSMKVAARKAWLDGNTQHQHYLDKDSGG